MILFKTIEEYISTFPEDTQVLLKKLRNVISETAPQAQECINYGMPTFKLKRNLVHFAAYKKHIGFYPSPSGIMAFREELSDYEYSKGAIKFPIDKEIPFDLLEFNYAEFLFAKGDLEKGMEYLKISVDAKEPEGSKIHVWLQGRTTLFISKRTWEHLLQKVLQNKQATL